jgi:ribosomal protein L9
VALLDNRRKIGDETTDTWEELLAAVETMPKRSKCVPLTSLIEETLEGKSLILGRKTKEDCRIHGSVGVLEAASPR